MTTADGTWSSIGTDSFDSESFSVVWLAALATYGVGDVVTTITIVYFVPLVTEANPVVSAAIETFGGGGFLTLKLLVFSLCLGISVRIGLHTRDRLLFYGPPLLLTGSGAVVTIFNLSLIVG